MHIHVSTHTLFEWRPDWQHAQLVFYHVLRICEILLCTQVLRLSDFFVEKIRSQ